ncbi:MAG: tellurite resistance TerB family protein [Rhizobiaceae bacterium]|uniref:tellurite resistance TerB family protein n=1 Tax=Mesorhizobium sp. Z1-4 TaxID=2448478 RepID=UPI000FD979B6|nr:tellurite resistance TerB family protein [Mesorhizobium sp. Z1-4]MBO6900765.1 tellurite resistance TerB family protein [Rhizobiaceae bacterium]
MKQPTAQEALIYLMVMVSASDREMGDPELSRIGFVVSNLPVFEGFQASRTLDVARECQEWLQRENGFQEILDAVAAAIPERLRETAYLLAVDVAVVDLHVEPEELRMLHILRDKLEIGRDAVSAIQRAAKARFLRL